jgi:choline dehydrogenase-like flavoprotein
LDSLPESWGLPWQRDQNQREANSESLLIDTGLGTCRQSARREEGVCNKWAQAHDVKNLFISDGSQFTTSTAENPTLTIVALRTVVPRLRAGRPLRQPDSALA